ncbi:MAG: HAMP domain-containing protein [Deltaproteobacteria bacterium]|nr:HAMP domain-containing protein [Deltaproteobacteria bacterium]MBW1813595.1 HAMP domain-containing protein [Deltaproteobacteria bacterium]MBW1846930.1 HAMP domain-containing protein [Deltaproteobacteria bacterium]MBW2180796.1 HAMP domain-containing protein [Deltaproteobacteria bacterium]MBW2364409.1 HAMP domain-containing protein [Deltaproteobacteria bacterium]
MLLKEITEIFRTLSFRLALLYASMFFGSSIIVFLITFFVLTFAMDMRIENGHLEEAKEYGSILSLKGMDLLKTTLRVEAESEGIEKIFLRVIDLEGKELFSSDVSNWKGVGISKEAIEEISDGKQYAPQRELLPESNNKILVSYNIIGKGIILQIAQSMEDNQKFMELFRNTFWGIMGIMTALSLAVGWTMARRSLKGVEIVAQTAEDISKGELNKRVHVKFSGTEIERLANTFNNMLDRIDTLIFGIKEVTDNIAHDLKIPITRIRGLAEVTLHVGRGDERYEEMAASTIEECDHLIQLINTLLDISERKSGVVKPTINEIDLVQSIHRACELFEPLAEEKDIKFSTDLPSQCFMTGDELGLQHLIINLLDNSFKYTPSKGKINISVNNKNEKVEIIIKDTGIGISKEDLPFIFQRFYRCDKSRSEEGFGLGLSLADTIAKYHGGNINADSALGKGSTFIVVLDKHPAD